MATVQDIVTDALRKLAIVSRDEEAQPEDITEGVRAFNQMLHAWKLQSVDVSHVDQVASDTFALGDEYQEGVVYNLASRLSPEYVVPANFDADAWFRDIQAAYMTIDSVTFDKALVYLPSDRARDGYTVDND
jgi:hypothetical protein